MILFIVDAMWSFCMDDGGILSMDFVEPELDHIIV